MSVKFKPGPRKSCDEAAHALSLVLSSSADFSNTTDDMPVFEDDTVQEDAPWDF